MGPDLFDPANRSTQQPRLKLSFQLHLPVCLLSLQLPAASSVSAVTVRTYTPSSSRAPFYAVTHRPVTCKVCCDLASGESGRKRAVTELCTVQIADTGRVLKSPLA